MRNRTVLLALALILIGVLFTLKGLNILFFNFGDFITLAFPLGLILIGLWMIARRHRSPYASPFDHTYHASPSPSATASTAQPSDEARDNTTGEPSPQSSRVSQMPGTGPSGKVKYERFFGDMFIDCNNVNLQNVEVSIFLGDVEIKLHGGRLAHGLNRMVISGFVGDVRILVPHDMPVYAQCSNFIGDIELFGRQTSGFGNNLEAQTANYSNDRDRLYIAINYFIGDIRIYVV